LRAHASSAVGVEKPTMRQGSSSIMMKRPSFNFPTSVIFLIIKTPF